MARTIHSSRRGLTIVELMVVIAVIGVLLALLIPAVQQVRATARQTTCRSNLHQVGIATHHYLDIHGEFPGAYGSSHGCLYALLPYVEQQSVFQQTTQISDPAAKRAAIPRIAIYLCPDDPTERRYNVTSYVINKGLLKAVARVRGFVFEPVHPADVTDGLTNTAFVSEMISNHARLRYTLPYPSITLHSTRQQIEELADICASSANLVPANSTGMNSAAVLSGTSGYNHLLPPNSPACDFSGFPLDVRPPFGNHGVGVNVLFADGSVRFASQGMDRTIWWDLGTINGGENTMFP